MIVEFDYNGKNRKLCVAKINNSTIEGFDLNDFSEETPEEIAVFVQDFAATEFKDIQFETEPDPNDPSFVLLSWVAPKNPKYTPYLKHYRKFSYDKTGLDLPLRVPFDQAKLEKAEKEVNEIYKDLTKNEDTTQAEKELVAEEGEIALQYIESEDSNETILKCTTRKGISYFYAPDKKIDEIGFNEFLKSFPNLIAFIYDLGKRNIPLTIRESQVMS